jgi:ribosomal protein S18 acetylase RimI-like enzyme
MSHLRIREGTEADAAFFRQCEQETTWESLPGPPFPHVTPEALRAALAETHALLLGQPGHVIFIAEVEGERAGLLWFGPSRNSLTGVREGWVYNVTVAPAFRGQGIGRRLMRHAEAHAQEQGYGVIGLTVAVQNEGARCLYRRLDYRETSIQMRKPLTDTGSALSPFRLRN